MIRHFLNLLPLALLLACGQDAAEHELGASRGLDPNRIGVNGSLVSLDAPWENDELVGAFREMKAGHIRYPAGTLGNYWDWDEGWVDANVDTSLMIKWVVDHNIPDSPNRYTIDNLALATKRTGAIPIFILNMLSKDLEHSLRGLRHARSLGVPIRYVEMGNELYRDIPFPKLRFPTPEDYGRTCQEWIMAIKAEFPRAKCAVVGSTLERHPRQVNWTKRVLGECPSADAVTFHKYAPSGLDGRRSIKELIEVGEEGKGHQNTLIRQGPAGVAERQQWELGLLDDEEAYTNMLTNARAAVASWKNIGVPKGMPIWATEFNVRGDSSRVLGAWAQTLLLTVYYESFYDSPVTITSIHNIVGPVFGAIHMEATDIDHVKEGEDKSVPGTLSASGLATAVYGEASFGASSTQAIRFIGPKVLRDDRFATFPAVTGRLFTGDETGAVLINYSSRSHRVTIPRELEGTGGKRYAADPPDMVTGKASVLDEERLTARRQLNLPAYSITVLSTAFSDR